MTEDVEETCRQDGQELLVHLGQQGHRDKVGVCSEGILRGIFPCLHSTAVVAMWVIREQGVGTYEYTNHEWLAYKQNK